jgi:thioredoxin-like negative regulator of GroEL
MRSNLVSSRDEEYERKVRHSTEPALVFYHYPLHDNSKAIASEIQKLSIEFTSVNFYRVGVRKHTMLQQAYNSKEVPAIVFVKNGVDFLILDEDVSLPNIRKGVQKLQLAAE